MEATATKRNGVHYTPPELAGFLARQIVNSASAKQLAQPTLSILDPACGGGELLVSLVSELRVITKAELQIFGFEIDPKGVAQTKSRLEELDGLDIQVQQADFLESDVCCANSETGQFDVVIANPPYVRTQTLGGHKAQALANQFSLSGRVDLYHAFTIAISKVLKPNGVLGLLTSNRFLSVKSGAAMRKLLRDEFDLGQVFDLGDTRLFDAAVLPAIVIGKKREIGKTGRHKKSGVKFHRIYKDASGCSAPRSPADCESSDGHAEIIDALEDRKIKGRIETSSGNYLVERGELVSADAPVWALANSKTRKWLSTVGANQALSFADVAEVKVGIKTTADSIFISEDWTELAKQCPEPELLLPLITHHDANRWLIDSPKKQVLYPYESLSQKRVVVDLKKYPKTKKYLQSNRERLEGRKYVADSGREWFEIWVPHQPADWAKPKIVWPDISEEPNFFLDSSGAVVNGDCYWIKLREDADPDWLYMILAVANSEIATTFYDTVFHNKLYAGRRRFMTQYVKEFPLPQLDSKIGKQIVRWVKKLVVKPTPKIEAKVEALVQKAFGF